jgi:hypothetical protein
MVVALGDLLQLPFNGPRTAKQATVHFIETVIRGVEHEATGNADSNSDRATIELDCKTLGNHCDSPARAAGKRAHDRVAQALSRSANV